MRRPSPATAIALVALVISMSGSAYAATGGTFILGRANTATAVSSLSNSKGTALHLSSKSGMPPLTVSNSVQVPRLNVSELGGIPAKGFITGTGRIDGRRVVLTGSANQTIVAGNDNGIIGECNQNGGTGADLVVGLNSGSAVWWNFNGVSDSSSVTSQVTPESKQDFVVVVQVTHGLTVSTYIASQTFDAGTNSCTFTAQLLGTG